MKLSVLVGLIASTNAAILTQYFTAATSTHWVTYTSSTLLTTKTIIQTHNGYPPGYTPVTHATTSSTTTPSTSSSQTRTPTTSSSSSSSSSASVSSTSSTRLTSTSAPTTPITSTLSTSTPSTSSTSSSSSSSSSSSTPTTVSTSTTTSSSSSSSSSTTVPTTSSSSTSSTSSTPATSTVNQNSPTSDVAFANEILAEHNRLRALHNTNALTWNNTLAAYAADYAANHFDCNNVQLIHSGGPYGENLAAGYVGGVDPTDAWYNEIHQYNYSNPGYSSATGHFTQLIWASTSQLGCARVTCNNAWRQYTICEYWTRGNIVGANTATTQAFFRANVLPLAN